MADTQIDVPEMRVSTLIPSTVSLLKRCGAWEELKPPISAAVEQMQVAWIAYTTYVRNACFGGMGLRFGWIPAMVVAPSGTQQHGIRRGKHTAPIRAHPYAREQQFHRMPISSRDPVHLLSIDIFGKRSSNGAPPRRRSAEDTTGGIAWIGPVRAHRVSV